MPVFGVKYRLGLIDLTWAEHLYAVMALILNDMPGVKAIKIGGYTDHVHILLSTHGRVSVSDIVKELKTKSSRWINEQRLTVGRFAWQEGSGKFSYSLSQLPAVQQYIGRQIEHHRVISFREEYEKFLRQRGVEISEYIMSDEPV